MGRISKIVEMPGCDRAPIVGPREVVGFVVASATTSDAFCRILQLQFHVGVHYTRRAIASRVEFREAGR